MLLAEQYAFSDAHLSGQHFVPDLFERQDVLVESPFPINDLSLGHQPDRVYLVAQVDSCFILLFGRGLLHLRCELLDCLQVIASEEGTRRPDLFRVLFKGDFSDAGCRAQLDVVV